MAAGDCQGTVSRPQQQSKRNGELAWLTDIAMENTGTAGVRHSGTLFQILQ